ncbi:MAG: hypothetical protein LBC95_02550 [Candidatus Nomurabacteria bacterium]|nr:hypothetical protein [Candidatus Nomurabacteria bacterium]
MSQAVLYGTMNDIKEPNCDDWAARIDNGKIDRSDIKRALSGQLDGVDTIILACTHYVAIQDKITAVAGGGTIVINPFEAVGKYISGVLKRQNESIIDCMQKNIGLVGVLTLTMAIALLSIITWQTPSMTISQHVASTAWSAILFGVASVVSSVCIAFCLMTIVRNKWRFGKIYTVSVVVVSLCLLLVGVFPRPVGAIGITADIHQIAAWTMLFIMLFLVVFVLISHWAQINKVAKTVYIGIVAYATAVLTTLFVWRQFYLENAYFIEAAFIGIFLIFILSLNYSKLSEKSVDTNDFMR